MIDGRSERNSEYGPQGVGGVDDAQKGRGDREGVRNGVFVSIAEVYNGC